MSRRFFRLLIFVLLGVFITVMMGCAQGSKPAAVQKARDYWPTNGWKTSTPEAQGMDSQKLYEMFKYIKDNKLGIHSILVTRNGYMVADGSYYPYSKDNKHILNSATKSITGGLVGIAINDGYIKGVDQKVLDIFGDLNIENVDDKKKGITVKNLLTMTSGLDWTEDGSYGTPTDSSGIMWKNQNAVQYVLSRPMKAEPGKEFYYSSGSSHVLSGIIQKTTGKKSIDYATEKLFKPLGISNVSWMYDKMGINSGSGKMFMKPEDMAKYGYLYLNKGKWEDKQIIPANWVEESTKKQVETPGGLAGHDGYGYQWWMNRMEGYSARGFGGQYIFVLPKYDIVAVFTSGMKSFNFSKPEEIVEKYIIPAVKSDAVITENKSSQDALKGIIEEIKKAPAPQEVPAMPEIASKISGKTFKMEDGETFRFDFNGGSECGFKWFCDGITYDTKVGLDGVYRISPMKEFYECKIDTVVGLTGSWVGNNKFVIDLKTLEDSDSYTLEFTFNDENTMSAKMATTLNVVTTMNTKGTAAN